MSLITKNHLVSLIDLFKNLLSFKADKTDLNVLSDDVVEIKDGLDTLSSDFQSYTPNWKANKGEPGYVENRTHYEGILEGKTFFENKKIPVEYYRGDYENYNLYFRCTKEDFLPNAKYKIKYQIGSRIAEISCINDVDNQEIRGTYRIKDEYGNSISGQTYLRYNDECFYAFVDYGSYAEVGSEETQAIISLYRLPVKGIKTLDKKFLPPDLQGDLTELINTVTETKMDKENPSGTGNFKFNTSNSTGIYSFNAAYNGTTGSYGFTQGFYTKATGTASHAEGYYTTASGSYAHAEGCYTNAGSEYQHVEGKYNIPDNANVYSHIVGNGSSSSTSNRSNAHTIDWKGNAWFSGDVYIGSTSGKNKDEGSKKLVTESYVNNQITETKSYVNNQITETKSYVNNQITGVNNQIIQMESEVEDKIIQMESYVKDQITTALSSLAKAEEVTW